MYDFLEFRMPKGYDEQTYARPYWIVRYPHRKRMRVAVQSICAARPNAVLDFGAGDGELLFEALDAGLPATRVVAYEPVPAMRARLEENI